MSIWAGSSKTFEFAIPLSANPKGLSENRMSHSTKMFSSFVESHFQDTAIHSKLMIDSTTFRNTLMTTAVRMMTCQETKIQISFQMRQATMMMILLLA